MPACVSWDAGDRERSILSLLGLRLPKRRSRNWAGGSGGCGINKRMEVQMDQVSAPPSPSRSKPRELNLNNAMDHCNDSTPLLHHEWRCGNVL